MSKTFNRAQAKAYRDEILRLRQDEEHKKNVREELKVLGTFREYMLRRRPTNTTLGCLIAAVDAYAEQLTGNSDALWSGTVATKRWWNE